MRDFLINLLVFGVANALIGFAFAYQMPTWERLALTAAIAVIAFGTQINL